MQLIAFRPLDIHDINSNYACNQALSCYALKSLFHYLNNSNDKTHNGRNPNNVCNPSLHARVGSDERLILLRRRGRSPRARREGRGIERGLKGWSKAYVRDR